jgi:Virulence factor
MATYRILYWREIPSQLKVADDGGEPVSYPLPDWFMALIDRVAMREGLVGSDSYLEQWRWGEDLVRPGPAADVARAVTDELVAQWDPVRRGRSALPGS